MEFKEMSKKVDIIVVYWSTDFMIEKCINQLLKTDYDNYKIYIVDNTRRSSDKLKSYFDSDRVRIIDGVDALIKGKKRSGFKRGRHHPEGIDIGIKKTTSEYIALFHPDSWPIDNNWLKECFKYMSKPKVKMVGIQHETSIHSCFQFFKRSTLKDLKYVYQKQKQSFSVKGRDRAILSRYVKYPDDVSYSRKKWDWGENFSAKLHGKGLHTIGFNPTKGYAPQDTVTDDCIETHWREFGKGGLGCVYGDMFFHVWKTCRKKKRVKKYMEEYANDDYLKSYYYIDLEYDNISVNNGIHNNSVYKNHRNFRYKKHE
jgi:hypothetical protein